MAIQIDVVVVVIDRVDESDTFIHFVGMPIAPCFNPCDQGLAGRPSGGKHGFERWVIDLIDILEKTAMLGLENRYLSL